MKIKFIIMIILLSILIPMKSSAEILSDAKFENVSIDEGLSNEQVTAIFQDSRGYMWIGTEDGLNRYDGEIIKIYNCNVEDENSLSSTYITDIEEDSYGNIWIATDNGLDFLNMDTDTIIRMKDVNDKYNLGNLKITVLLKSSYDENIMWVGTENGLMKIDTKDKAIKSFYHDSKDSSSLTNSSITCLEEDEKGSLWVGTRKGLNIIYKDSKIYNKQYHIRDDRLFISHISKDSDRNLWISTKDGIFVYNTSENQKNHIYMIDSIGTKKYNINERTYDDIYTFKNNNIKFYNNFIFNDSKDNTWISSSNGAIRLKKDKNEFKFFRKDASSKYSITSNVITCFYEDSNGTMWVGTDKGVNILNDNTVFSYNYYKEIKDENIVSILQRDENIWMATKFNGIYIYDSENGELIDRLYEKDDFTLNNCYIKNIFEIDDTNILISTNKEIIGYDTTTNTYIMRKLIGDDYSSELDYCYSDKENIWIATTSDFYSYNIKTEEKTYYSKDMRSRGINPGRIKYILQDNKDKDILWLGGVDTGLIKFHKEKGVLETYTSDSLDENSLINDYINCMAFDNSDNLWIGTNIGLSKFDIKTKKFTSYTTAQGLTDNFISSILIDDNYDIWISTNKGLNKFNVKKESFIKFTRMDGLQGYQFNLNSSLKLENGNIIFGSTEGCTYFNPEELVDYKRDEKNVVIGDIYVGKDRVVYDGNELILEYNHRDLNINYFLPSYESLNNITYEYMLEGIDSDWIYINSRSNLEFKSLEPGNYTLKVRARDVHGELTKETSMNIKIKSPIWKTPLACLVYILIILGLFIYIFNRVNILQRIVNQKTMKLNKQLEENKRLSEEIIENEKFKNNYFVNLSHELRTPINVIISTVQLIDLLVKNKNMTHEKFAQYMDIISKNCDNLLIIINDIIDSSKIETGKYKINKKNNDIVYIVEEAALNMSKFIEEKGLSLIIDPDMEEKIISCDKTEIERCIINLLGNAVKFTHEGGEIRVYIKEVENNVEITVEDTGIGISKEDQEFIFKRFSQADNLDTIKTSSSGIGLTLVKDIAELHNGYIRLESEPNKGSRFTIGIPDLVEDVEAKSEF